MTKTLKLFLTVFLTCAFFTHSYLTTNDASRFATTMSIVENRSLEITSTLPRALPFGPECGKTKACWQPRDFMQIGSRYYSDKAPLGAFLGVPAYFIISRFTDNLPILIYFVSLFTAGLLTACTSVLIFKTGALFHCGERQPLVAALAHGLCSMALFYGSVFYSSAITAFFIFAAFYLLAKHRVSPRGDTELIVAGVCLALSIMSDYYTALCALVLLAYSWSSTRAFAKTAIAFALTISLLLIYNYHLIGNAFDTGYRYSYLSSSLHGKGFYGVTLPTLDGLRNLASLLFTFDVNAGRLGKPDWSLDWKWGFFIANPVVLFSIAYYHRFMRFRREAIAILVMFAGYLYLNMSLGWFDAYSARFFMPVLPFLFLPIFTLPLGSRLPRNLFFFIIGLSLFVNFIGADLFLHKDPAIYAPGYWSLYKPGAQNLLGALLDSLGYHTSYLTFAALFVPYALLWMIPARGSRPATEINVNALQ